MCVAEAGAGERKGNADVRGGTGEGGAG